MVYTSHVVVQLLSCLWFCNPCTTAHQASLSFTISQSLLKHMFIELLMESNHRIRWSKYWSSNFSISLSNEYSGLIFCEIDWFDLLAVQGTLKSLLHHHNSKVSVLWHSAFFMVQLSQPSMTTGKTIAFISKVMSLLFNTLSRFVIVFLPKSKCLLISWLQSPSAVILEPKKIVCHCFQFFPICLPWSGGTRCHDVSFLDVEGFVFFLIFFLF